MAEAQRGIEPRLLLALALSAALLPLNTTMVAVALPVLATALERDSGVVRHAIVTSYLLTSVVVQSFGGKLGDRLGYRRTLSLGQLVFAGGAALAYTWPVLEVLGGARVLMAAGGAIIVPSAAALLRTELPAERRGRAFGAFGAVMALSAAIGPKIGGALVAAFGWTSIFLANIPVLLAAAALARGGRRESTKIEGKPPRAPLDLLGAGMLASCLGSIVLGSQGDGTRVLLGVGLLGLFPFVLWELRTRDPIVDVRLFRNGAFVGGSTIIGLHNLAMYSLLFALPQVAARRFGSRPEEIGNVLLALLASMVVSSPLAGRLADRWGARALALCGSLLGCGALVLMHAQAFTELGDVVLPLVMLGAGLGMASSPAQAATLGAVPREQSGMAAGLTATIRYIGGVLGLSVLGMLLSDQGSGEIALEEHRAGLRVFAGALLAAACLSWTLPARAATESDPRR